MVQRNSVYVRWFTVLGFFYGFWKSSKRSTYAATLKFRFMNEFYITFMYGVNHSDWKSHLDFFLWLKLCPSINGIWWKLKCALWNHPFPSDFFNTYDSINLCGSFVLRFAKNIDWIAKHWNLFFAITLPFTLFLCSFTYL